MEEIYTPGEKIKKIRKSLNLKQIDIIDDTVTRNLISNIENNKNNLTKKTAKIIAGKINEHYRKNNIDKNLNVEYLLESKSFQATKKLTAIIERFDPKIKKLDEKLFEIDYLSSIIENTKEKADMLMTIGDILLEEKYYLKAYTYFIKTLEILIVIEDIENLPFIYYKLGKVSVELKKYAQGIFFNKFAISMLNQKNKADPTTILKLLYNLALGYKKVKNYDKALEILDETDSYIDFSNAEQKAMILILKGNLFIRKKSCNQALECYEASKKLSENENLDEYLALTYINFSALYTKTKEYKKALDYLLLALPLQKVVNKKDIPLIYHDIGELYRKLEEYDLAKDNLLKPILSSEYEIEESLLIKIYIELLKVYIAKESFKDIYALISSVEIKFKLNNDISCDLKIKVEHFYLIAIEYLFDKDQLTTKRLIDNLKGGKENDKD